MKKTSRKTAKKNISVGRTWHKWMALGCNHGIHADATAQDAAIAFKDDYDPELTIHLGDNWDTTAFRAGASGSVDEGTSVPDDCMAGVRFLERYNPDLMFMGNHEDRLWALQDHPKALVSFAANCVIEQIEKLAEDINCEIVPYASIADENAWRMIGDTLFGHGFVFNENAVRDHVEMLGHPVVIAHLHKVMTQTGRVVGAPDGHCVGTLADIPAMAYAGRRRATTSWSQGWAYGEYTKSGGGSCQVNLHKLKRPKVQFKQPLND